MQRRRDQGPMFYLEGDDWETFYQAPPLKVSITSLPARLGTTIHVIYERYFSVFMIFMSLILCPFLGRTKGRHLVQPKTQRKISVFLFTNNSNHIESFLLLCFFSLVGSFNYLNTVVLLNSKLSGLLPMLVLVGFLKRKQHIFHPHHDLGNIDT